MILPRAYLQALDTVNFNNIAIGLKPAENKKAFAIAMVYSIFYDIVLSPNQVLDLSFLRAQNLDPSIDPSAYPFSLAVDQKVYKEERKFTAQLLGFLRRGGESAFIFSSVADGSRKSQEWGEFINSSSAGYSDEKLLQKAKVFGYAEIVDWASKLDDLAPRLNIKPYCARTSFSDIFGKLIEWPTSLGSAPHTRSQVYKQIESKHFDLTEEKVYIDFADLASSIQYTQCLGDNIRLSLKSTSKFELSPDSSIDHLWLDFEKMSETYSAIWSSLSSANYEELGSIRMESVRVALNAWDQYKERADSDLFPLALRKFFEKIPMETTNPDVQNANKITLGIPGVVAGEFNPTNLCHYIEKAKLRCLPRLAGFDKFIGLDPNYDFPARSSDDW